MLGFSRDGGSLAAHSRPLVKDRLAVNCVCVCSSAMSLLKLRGAGAGMYVTRGSSTHSSEGALAQLPFGAIWTGHNYNVIGVDCVAQVQLLQP